MGLKIVNQELTNLNVDGIVLPVDENLNSMIYLDFEVNDLIGDKIRQELQDERKLNLAQTLTLDIKNQTFNKIIFIAVPRYSLNKMVERMLYICYENALKLAKEYDMKSIAIPLLSFGRSGFPLENTLNVLTQAIHDFLAHDEIDIYLTFTKNISDELACSKKYQSLLNYIDNHKKDRQNYFEAVKMSAMKPPKDVQDQILNADLTFSYQLYELMEKRNIKEVELYKKANIDRKLFSKIMRSGSYQPSKNTAILLALALELNLDETLDLLSRAGYTLSHALKNDLAIKWCIEHKNYNVYEVSFLLLELGLKPLF